MLLIWGIRSRAKTLSTGTFFCPHCGGDRTYAHKQLRRWFTLFFLPVIPMKVLGELIECQTCRTQYDPQVLSMPTTSDLQQQLLGAYREAVVSVLRSGDGTGRAAALSVLSRAAGHEWSEADLDADLRLLDTGPLFDRLQRLATSLTTEGKESLLGAAATVAGAGSATSAARDLLERIARALGMTPAHARGVIDSAVERLA